MWGKFIAELILFSPKSLTISQNLVTVTHSAELRQTIIPETSCFDSWFRSINQAIWPVEEVISLKLQ